MRSTRRVVSVGLAVTLGFAMESAAVAGPTQNPRLTAIPPNTAIDLGKYTCENPEGAGGGCTSITDYSGMVYDHIHHQLHMFGGGHAQSTGTLRTDVSSFDFTTLTWSSGYTPTSCAEMNLDNMDTTNGSWRSTGQPLARHTYDMLVMVDDPPRMMMMGSGALGGEVCSGSPAPAAFSITTKVGGYDPTTRKWTFGNTILDEWDGYSSAEYDPVSKATMVLGSYGLWAYDAKTDSFFGSQFVPTEIGYANNMVYAPATDRMYYFSRGDRTRVFELALDRAEWKSSTLTELVGSEGPKTPETGFAYDTVNRVIGGAVVDGSFSAFDPKAKSWNTVVMQTDPPGGTIGSMVFHEIAFDPIDGVYIFLTDYASGFRVWAYRYAGSPPPPPAETPDGSSPTSPGSGGSETSNGDMHDDAPSEGDGGGCAVGAIGDGDFPARHALEGSLLLGLGTFARVRIRRRTRAR